MKQVVPVILLCLVCLFATGCSVARDLGRVLVIEPSQFPTSIDHFRTQRTNRRLAKEALAYRFADPVNQATPWPLRELLHSHHGLPVSRDYADGFIDGFADHLTYGGGGLPPLAPPRRYWRIQYATPEGHAAVQEWYAGFTDGTSSAIESGIRQARIVPSSVAAGTGVLQRDSPPEMTDTDASGAFLPPEELPEPSDPTETPLSRREPTPAIAPSAEGEVRSALFQPGGAQVVRALPASSAASSAVHVPRHVRRLPETEVESATRRPASAEPAAIPAAATPTENPAPANELRPADGPAKAEASAGVPTTHVVPTLEGETGSPDVLKASSPHEKSILVAPGLKTDASPQSSRRRWTKQNEFGQVPADQR